MYPVHLAFSGYAIIGLTLLILSASIAVYLLRLKAKTEATWAMIAFFIMVMLSGIATLLTNGILYWDSLFAPWQDFWILAGGVILARFAYLFPAQERSREAKIVLALAVGLAVLALTYCLVFSYQFLSHWVPELEVSDAYYLLLPLGILIIVLVFLRRAAQFSRSAAGDSSGFRNTVRHLIYPQGQSAQVFRNLALALSLAFLPALQTLLSLPYPYSFILSNIGALLAITTMGLVYFSFAPEVHSFMAKLVGITLATVLLIFAIFGVVDIYREEQHLHAERQVVIAAVQEALLSTADLDADPLHVAYVVSWNANQPDDAESYRQIYLADNETNFDLKLLIEENQTGYLEGWVQTLGGRLDELTRGQWLSVQRYRTFPRGSNNEDYVGYLFSGGDRVYEIGFSSVVRRAVLSALVIDWLLLILGSSTFVLLAFPFFFRRTLVEPLGNLLGGIRRVNRGELDTAVPVKFNDEIGSLTRSFNDLILTLKLGQERQDELFAELQDSYVDLEDRISERTRELAAFTDLTMLSGDQDSVTHILQPVLSRIIELDLCHALAVHLLAEDEQTLVLVAQRLLPQLQHNMVRIAVTADFARRIHSADNPFLASPERDPGSLPEVLQLAPYPLYLGCPLMAGDQAHGWLSCYRPQGQDFKMGEISLLVALARQMGIIVENHQLRQHLKQAAATIERRRLGRDLHDSVTQLLYGITLFTRSAKDAVLDDDQERLEQNLNNLGETAGQALREMRFMLFELQPPSIQDLGLAEALNARLNMVERHVGLAVTSEIDESLSAMAGVDQELYFVAIEALNNSLKHASAKQIDLSLFQINGDVCLQVADNGRGFDVSRPSSGLGLDNMRQRVEDLGGHLEIDSALNAGTKIIATVPVYAGSSVDKRL